MADKIPVETIRHKDRRVNIPTEELRGFVKDEEKNPKKLLYPRDQSLDPQLVWKGKDEQNTTDLAVDAPPIYIQEKIHPQAIIEDLRRQASSPEPQMELFSDFNGIQFEDLVDFYHHDQNWSNRMILGDSLQVMASLAEKEGLKGKVQTIYMDPPYGIKFGSNWQVSTRKRDVKDGKVEDATRQPEQIRAFRDTWKLGIHSYLPYLRDRLLVARDLLTDSGSMFVQIGDENVHLVRSLLDEVLGSENFCSQIAFTKTTGLGTKLLSTRCDYLLWYAKDRNLVKYRQLFTLKAEGEEGASQYDWVHKANGDMRRLGRGEQLENGDRLFHIGDASAMFTTPHLALPIQFRGREVAPPANRQWQTTQEGMQRLLAANRLLLVGNSLRYVRYLHDFPVNPVNSLWTDTGVSGFADPKTYVVQTSTKVVERCLLMTTDPGDLALDPTCGSGTTAYVAEQWGRRWITIDTSRVALALARTRLMAARYPYYLLADSPEGIKKEVEVGGAIPPALKTDRDVRKGFVYKRTPHVTLKSIANNPDIREGMTQQQIDAAIARHADAETLYDQPYEDGKRVRVCGPFSVESLSPHRVLSADEDHDGVVSEQEQQQQQDFSTMILDNLKKAGVRTTIKDERLVFSRLEPHAGVWIHAIGEYTDASGRARRVAVCIGPEHGTVSPDLIKDAAKESRQGEGVDVLVVCGFAFDPHVSEETKQWGNLQIIIARMNPDLAMGDELLKKTGAGNLFMVFGEPDMTVTKDKDGEITVAILGVDVYDPTTGEIRSHSTNDIACWFIDTDYNGESFFVRHAYFTGADEPYEKLKRALRADIDEEAWSAIYSTKSRPFKAPKSGKIAVKVINHYGDEVLKVHQVAR